MYFTSSFHFIILDRYLFGNMKRKSTEAPIDIVDIHHEKEELGGAANVALNLKSLGATPILCSVIGTENQGELFLKLMH